MQEEVTRDGDHVRVQPHEAPAFIRRQGENCRRGAIVLPTGATLTPVALAAAASCGVTTLPVPRRARTVHIATGAELVAPETTPSGTQIRDSNSILVRAFLEQNNALLRHQERTGDEIEDKGGTTPDSWRRHTDECDLLLISGGASVGDRDRARSFLLGQGFEIVFDKVNLRPGKPTIFATRGAQLAFAIPGNPVSHWVVLELLVRPALRRRHGQSPARVLAQGNLAAEFTCRPDQRETWWPCRAEPREGSGWELSPLPFVSSGDVMTIAGANALLPLPSGQEKLPAGPVSFLLSAHE